MVSLATRKIDRRFLSKSDFVYSTIEVRRVSKTTKGGRTMSVSVTVVIGDQKGVIGFGVGKGSDVSLATQKALQNAQKELIEVPLKKTVVDSSIYYTIHHNVSGYSSGSRVNLMSTRPGTSLSCSPVVRDACYVLGITDLVSKTHKSTNKGNTIRAVVMALKNLKTPNYVKKLQKSAIFGANFDSKTTD